MSTDATWVPLSPHWRQRSLDVQTIGKNRSPKRTPKNQTRRRSTLLGRKELGILQAEVVERRGEWNLSVFTAWSPSLLPTTLCTLRNPVFFVRDVMSCEICFFWTFRNPNHIIFVAMVPSREAGSRTSAWTTALQGSSKKVNWAEHVLQHTRATWEILQNDLQVGKKLSILVNVKKISTKSWKKTSNIIEKSLKIIKIPLKTKKSEQVAVPCPPPRIAQGGRQFPQLPQLGCPHTTWMNMSVTCCHVIPNLPISYPYMYLFWFIWFLFLFANTMASKPFWHV